MKNCRRLKGLLMRANPGGEIAPEDVVGRDRLIQRLWETLDSQSVVMVAERRIGKSCIIKKMVAESPGSVVTVYRDVEGVNAPIDFVERVYRDVAAYLTVLRRTAGRVSALLNQLAGAEIGGLVKFPEAAAIHWKSLLEGTLEDLVEHQDRLVVLFWDELPSMLKSVADTSGEAVAMEVLDTLRGLRQMRGRLRMVYSGSVGLHHVTAALREAGHGNDATNDMRVVEVPELAFEDACFLAGELLDGEQLQCKDRRATAACIARVTNCIPYYIHWVVANLKDRGDVADSELAERIVAEAMVDHQDSWHLQHYRDRLKEYYGEDRLPVVLALLDELAAAKGPIPFDQLCSGLATALRPDESEAAGQILGGDRELLRHILTLLQRDHYIRQEPNEGTYSYRFPLIQRWWRVHRSLP
jgi:hypothetical protein